MGKGGGSQPQVSTAYQTNLPEYAKPYVQNMLGAAQNQLFTTSPGATTTNPDGTTTTTPGEITGFKPYTPYSNDPTQYFAGPSSLQRGVYNEAGQMQTPGAYGQAQGMAGMSGMGQFGTAQQAGMYGGLGTALGAAGAMQAMPAFGAGQQFASQVTDPNAMAQYMSPYQQNVTDIAKMNAVREAQMAGNQANLGAARQGTYGGARQALAGAERERNLLSNLSNIQAQGSQSAYDRALAQQQFGANLGLQGIQTGLQGVQAGMQGVGQGLQGVGAQQAGYAGAGQAASTLGQLGGAQQQADLARLGFQQQTGKEQQAYQQNIINQQIQDYATQQQYPFMQLSTMSNLLRGLPMQGMSTQQYQAQPTALQQGIGLLGAGASLYGGVNRKEGGTIKEYAAGGTIRGLENKIDDIGDAGGAKGLQALLAQTKSPAAKELIMERMREEGIAAGNTGGLMTNMAGGGIIAFENGGSTLDKIKDFFYARGDFAPEKNRMSGSYKGDAPLQGEGIPGLYKQREEEKRTKAASIKEQMRLNALEPEGFNEPIARSGEDPYAVATSTLAPGVTEPPVVVPATSPAVATTRQDNQYSGLAAVQEQRKKLLGLDDVGDKSAAFMKALEERQTGLGKQNESDRYLRMAEAFAKFGSTAGPIGATAAEALGGFAKGEGAARKEQDKMQLEGMKMQSDLEKARRAEIRGDFEGAEKIYNSIEDRQNRRDIANIGAAASGQAARFDKEAVERIMKEEGISFAQALERVKGASRSEGIDMQIASKAYAAVQASVSPGGANSSQYKKLMKEDPTGVAAKQFADGLVQEQIRGIKASMGMGGGGGGGSGKVIDFGSIK
jgi:hypothetical protein